MTKINNGQLHLIKLVAKGQNNQEGWAPVSLPIFRFMAEIPTELVEFVKINESSGRARLTDAGQNLINSLAWLQ